MKLELSPQEINNLLNFLNRSQIQGSESEVWLVLRHKIQQQFQSDLQKTQIENQIKQTKEKVKKAEKNK